MPHLPSQMDHVFVSLDRVLSSSQDRPYSAFANSAAQTFTALPACESAIHPGKLLKYSDPSEDLHLLTESFKRFKTLMGIPFLPNSS
ncbi:hypothetical protein L3Y34_016265 [Caenorhabditis briggsae]|uniref:Uncharacterized protein n=1 Tax=Caenorhabditis briggsae TaxID=6238 RepID=A0AAE9DVV8_CAEBR|nr:hypothetical protein L3Y34_016265 [Caenorhabditis briggsae]